MATEKFPHIIKCLLEHVANVLQILIVKRGKLIYDENLEARAN